jgi:hypothetical protein
VSDRASEQAFAELDVPIDCAVAQHCTVPVTGTGAASLSGQDLCVSANTVAGTGCMTVNTHPLAFILCKQRGSCNALVVRTYSSTSDLAVCQAQYGALSGSTCQACMHRYTAAAAESFMPHNTALHVSHPGAGQPHALQC